MDKTVHVVVIGGGFGGLTFCQQFHHPSARITIVDQHNHHLFQPLLYQVATAGLSAPEIAQPIRSILSDREDITVLMDEVRDLNLAATSAIPNGRSSRPDSNRWKTPSASAAKCCSPSSAPRMKPTPPSAPA
jgi:NADH dehydrogenase FAD-containing subunit